MMLPLVASITVGDTYIKEGDDTVEAGREGEAGEEITEEMAGGVV